jgi:hypothetical protein
MVLDPDTEPDLAGRRTAPGLRYCGLIWHPGWLQWSLGDRNFLIISSATAVASIRSNEMN